MVPGLFGGGGEQSAPAGPSGIGGQALGMKYGVLGSPKKTPRKIKDLITRRLGGTQSGGNQGGGGGVSADNGSTPGGPPDSGSPGAPPPTFDGGGGFDGGGPVCTGSA